MFTRFRQRFGFFRLPPTLTSLDAYARWAALYPPYAHNPLMQAEQQSVMRLLPDVHGQTVLDLACGTGRYALLALAQGASKVIAFDNSAAMLEKGREAALPKIHWGLATSEALPLADASVQGVICGLALGHLPRLKPSIDEISRVLQPGGWALVSDFHPFLSLNGARRTFTTPEGKTFAVEHYPHLYTDYHQAACEAGLGVDSVLEPGLNGAVVPPVVLIFRFRKPG